MAADSSPNHDFIVLKYCPLVPASVAQNHRYYISV
jgi:hypothetical protein